MNFEGGSGVRRDEVVLALKSAGVMDLVDEEFGLSGNFSDSNMHFLLFDRTKPYWVENGVSSCLIAEGYSQELGWDIWIRISFKCVPERYNECSKELHRFLRKLGGHTSGYFLLSFQYENVYAIRDENGLRFLEDF
jgi:hypothetical protein